ncbi:preprotein translocase subunit YajC [Kineococcus gynurae]|uniref:Preprotein translocase subunit YajC n=1 Tax=Kineococcus gynurae TaxID=452979 RepID=A0ABV5LUV9_9ACTN
MEGQLFFLLLMGALLVWMITRTRKQQKNQQQLQNSVAPGSEVMTTSGTYGRVVGVEDDAVQLEIAPGVVTRWSRRAVARVLTNADTPVETTPGSAATTEDSVGGIDLTKPAGAEDDTRRS